MRTPTIGVAASAFTFFAGSSLAQYLGPSPYLSPADSPFIGSAFDYFHFEDFEDGALSIPGVAANAGFVTSPGPQIDSVDGDDGAIDGNGNAGRSWYPGVSTLRFSFDEAALGTLPTHVGLVWTDVGIVPGGAFGFADLVIEAFDADGISLGIHGAFTVGDGVITGETGEDRFFGILSVGGISAIEMRMPATVDWEVDHLQFGLIPSPGSGLLLLLAPLAVRRRRERSATPAINSPPGANQRPSRA